ncbi:MAG: PDZ domain-containing protein [Ginsengibacter sp.]
MKTIFVSALFTACCGLFTINGFAQKEQSQLKKNEEIIIRKNNDAPTKTTIVIDSNNITINGKPLADYNGDVTVLKRGFMGSNGNSLFSPGQSLMVFGNSNKAFLGVLTAKTDKGAVIKNVIDESGAQKAGLKNDDIITKFGDKEITSPDDLRNAVQSYKPGDEVTLYYLRDGKKNSVKIELGKTPGNGPMTYNLDSLKNIVGQYFNGNNQNFGIPQMPGNQFYFNNNKPKLGIKIEDTEDGNGAKILNVDEGSAAQKAGLKTGDIITQINGEKIKGANDVRAQVMQSDNSNNYKMKVKRNNKDINIEVRILKVLNKINV